MAAMQLPARIAIMLIPLWGNFNSKMELLNISHPKKLVVYIQNLKGMSEQNTIHYFGLVVDQCHF